MQKAEASKENGKENGRFARKPTAQTTAEPSLQQLLGNRAVGRLALQRKMTLNAVGDKYEQEADAVAKEVVQKLNAPQPAQRQEVEEEDPATAMAQRQISVMREEAAPEDEELQLQRQEDEEELQAQRQEAAPKEEEPLQMKAIQRQEATPEDEELQLQRQESAPEGEPLQLKAIQISDQSPNLPISQSPSPAKPLMTKPADLRAGGPVDDHIAHRITQAQGGGSPLADDVRQPMEQAFATDFSHVRIHTNHEANNLNHFLEARAFTTGQDIFFKENEYIPTNSSGQELLAHELTHVVQQEKTNSKDGETFRPALNRKPDTKIHSSRIPDQDIQYEFIAHKLAYGNIRGAEQRILKEWGYQPAWRKFVTDPRSGFFAGLIMPNDNSSLLPIIAFRGTESGMEGLLDWMSNLHPEAVGWNQFKENKKFVANLIDYAGGQVDVTGHSLGGALAQHAALTFPASINKVVTFQSPGISAQGVKQFENSKKKPKVFHHFTKGDLVDLGGEQHLPGTFYEHDTSNYVTHNENVLDAHLRFLFNRPDFRKRLDMLGLNNVYEKKNEPFIVRAIHTYEEHPNPYKKWFASSARKVLGTIGIGIPIGQELDKVIGGLLFDENISDWLSKIPVREIPRSIKRGLD